MTPRPEWKGLALVVAIPAKKLAEITGRSLRTAQNWRKGASIPGAVEWKAIVAESGREAEWRALSEWRKCRKPGRPVSVERQRTIIAEARRKLGEE